MNSVYVKKVEQEFVKTYVDSDTIDVKLAETTMELLKLGTAYDGEYNTLTLTINDTEYELSLPKLYEVADKELYQMFLPMPEVEKSDVISKKVFCKMLELADSVQKEKDTMKEEYETKRKEYKEKISALTTDNESLKKTSESNIKEIERLKQRVEELESENNDYADLQLNYDNLCETFATVQSERDKLQEDLEFATSSNADEDAAITQLKEDYRELKSQVSEYTATIANLEKLAYEDSKFNIMNSNAFNRDYSAAALANTIFAMVSICNMRVTNAKYGRENGDRAISIVGKELSSMFGKDHVYRVMGDVFNIIIANGTYNYVYGQLSDLRKNLSASGSQIDVVFGVADGSLFNTKGEVVKHAENKIKTMKESSANETGREITNWTQEEKKEEKKEDSNKPKMLDISDLLNEYLNDNGSEKKKG